jgi:tetratricopeptide (TPR) repeat protein
MLSVQKIIQLRIFQVSALTLVVFAVACTRIPLFNYLGFEFSALTVLISGFISGITLLLLWRRTDFKCKSDVWLFIGQSVFTSFVLIAIPFLISLGNALFVKNCSIGDGVKLYSMVVIPGTLFSVSLALLTGIVFEKWRKTIFTLLYIIILFHIPLVTLLRPQIFAFNPIIGFFPGFTYDEALQITHRLLTYRLATLAAAGCFIAGAVWIWQIRKNRSDDKSAVRDSFPIIEMVLLVLLSPVVVIVFSLSDRLGFSSSTEFIRQKLAGNYKTEHFEIIYSAGSVKRERIEQLGRLHEFYFEKLTRELNINFQGKIISFIYASPEQKGRLIGAANTDISKPWLKQMHINLADVDPVLPHEMVHILASTFGWSPLQIAPNSGLIEGLAVALDRNSAQESIDRAAALACAAGINPNIEALFTSAGFAQASAAVGYTMAGSFCRSLIDSFGVEKFKVLYRTGDYYAVYRKDLPSLLAMWQTSIKNIPLNSADSVKAVFFFRHPSIFGKECARVIANLNSETHEQFFRHDFERALVSAEQSLALSNTSEAVLNKTTALFEMKRFKDVIAFSERQLRDIARSYSLLPIHLRLGDAYWAMDSLPQAKQEYEGLARMHLSVYYEEMCALRLESLKNAQERTELEIYFIYTLEDTTRIARLERLMSPVAKYILGREYAAKERFAESVRMLESLKLMESKTLEFFRLRRIGKDWFELQNYEKAAAAFGQSLQVVPNVSLKTDTEEWIEKCNFWESR